MKKMFLSVAVTLFAASLAPPPRGRPAHRTR